MGYNSDYQHFDTIIWRLPTWCSGLFFLTLTGALHLEGSSINALAEASELPPIFFVGLYMGISFAMLFVASHILFRLRVHQTSLLEIVDREGVPFAPTFFSAQTWLQLLLNFEISALFFIIFRILKFADNASWESWFFSVAFFIILSGIHEATLYDIKFKKWVQYQYKKQADLD